MSALPTNTRGGDIIIIIIIIYMWVCFTRRKKQKKKKNLKNRLSRRVLYSVLPINIVCFFYFSTSFVRSESSYSSTARCRNVLSYSGHLQLTADATSWRLHKIGNQTDTKQCVCVQYYFFYYYYYHYTVGSFRLEIDYRCRPPSVNHYGKKRVVPNFRWIWFITAISVCTPTANMFTKLTT